MMYLILATLLSAAFAHQDYHELDELIKKVGISKIVASWSLCTGSDATECDTGKYANVTTETFSPNPPPVGQNFSILGAGFALEAIAEPSFDMHINDGIVVNTHVKGDGCVPTKYDFPLNDGTVYYDGVKCPINPGSMDVPLHAFVASKAPSGKVITTLKLYDQPKQKGNCIMCTITTLTLS
eukprot:526445_1